MNLTAVLFFITLSVLSQKFPCNNFKQESIDKINYLSKKMIDFENPYYLSKKELFSIVSPEYITFSETKNNIELIIVKSNLVFNNRKIDLSFGPFQMKMSFIKKLIKETPAHILHDSILEKLKKKKFDITIGDIDYLNKIETQWKLLRAFEYNNKYIYKKYSIKGIYTLYNRGGASKKATIFNKIICSNKSYEEWCEEILIWSF